jgi:hypothetical protein
MQTKVVKEDEATDPLDVGVFGARRIMAHTQDLPHLVEKPRRPGQSQLAHFLV